MHRGTPIIVNSDLCIYHDITKSDRMIYYHPVRNDLLRQLINRYSKPQFINGDEFNPKGIVSFPWQAIVQKNIRITKEFDVSFVDGLEERSRLIGLLEMVPASWPVIDLKDPSTLKDLAPQKCFLGTRNDGSANSLDGKFCVNVGYRGIEILKLADPISFNDTDGYIMYDPAQTAWPWEKDTVPRIEQVIAKYEKFCEDKFGVTSSGIGGKKPMDFAHMTPAEKTSICEEFDTRLAYAHPTIMSVISFLAQKRCTSSKAWRRTQGHNMKAAVLMTLVEGGKVTLKGG